MDTTTSLKMASLAVQSLFNYVEEEDLPAIIAHLEKFRDVDSRSDVSHYKSLSLYTSVVVNLDTFKQIAATASSSPIQLGQQQKEQTSEAGYTQQKNNYLFSVKTDLKQDLHT